MHLIGRTEAEKKSPSRRRFCEIRRRNEVGSASAFDTRAPRNVFTITLVNGELLIDLQGKGKSP